MTRRLSPIEAAEMAGALRGPRRSILDRTDLSTVPIPLKAEAEG
jgi:hypothetical protein